jgi:hypothetical protein
METDELTTYLTEFVKSRHAERLCRPYHADPAGALTDLYFWFAARLHQPIRNPRAWVSWNAALLLRNYLRKECRQLGQ